MTSRTSLLALLVASALVGSPLAAEDSSALLGKAWGALSSGNDEEALKAVNQCIAQHGEFAAKQQAELTSPPAADEAKDTTFARGPLNDVGTSLLLKGDLLLKKGDKAGAKEAYQKLVTSYSYAKCWDPQGWFWSPAEAAKKKLEDLP